MGRGFIRPDSGPIVLDQGRTLAELYRSDGTKSDLVFVPLFLSSRIKLTSAASKPSKFLYSDDIVNQNPQCIEDEDRLRREYAIKYFAMIVQRFIFAAGNMPVLVIDPEVVKHDDPDIRELHERRQLLQTLDVLDIPQKPELIFCSNLKQWRLQNPGQKLAVTFPIDDLEHHAHLTNPEKHYELLSKRGLARSTLMTPACKILDFEPPRYYPQDCCEACREHLTQDEIPTSCSGPRKSWLKNETDRVVREILARPVPFVLKLQQTVSGAGTFIIETTEQRSKAAKHIATAVLRFLLARITPYNSHLHPASILLSDFVSDIEDTISTTFFVTGEGEYINLCCSRQQMSGGNQWIGSTISYCSQQDDLEKRTSTTAREVASFLHRSGYTGPVGIDILQDTNGSQWVVDLNVRTPSSLILGPLRGHFTSRRLFHACLITKEFAMDRESFLDLFESQLREGRLIIVAWFEISPYRSTASLVLGAENEMTLAKFVRAVTKYGIGCS